MRWGRRRAFVRQWRPSRRRRFVPADIEGMGPSFDSSGAGGAARRRRAFGRLSNSCGPGLLVARAVVLVGSVVYIAARFSDRGALVNIGFWLALAGLAMVIFGGGAREFAAILQSRVAMACAAYAAAIACSILVAPDVETAWRSFRSAHGRAFISAMFVAYAASRPEHARWLLAAIAMGAVVVSLKQSAEHWAHWLAAGQVSPAYQVIRKNAPGHAFYLPALIAVALLAAKRWLRIGLAVAALGEAALMLFAAARGAWLSVAAGSLVAAVMSRRWRLLAVLAISVVALGGIVVMLLPEHLIAVRLQHGFSTSGRVAGTWGPALDLIAERPVIGYGYGPEAFDQAFDAAVTHHPEWGVQRSIGPHNIYLGAWVAGGPLLLGTMLWTFFEVGVALVGAFRASDDSDVRALATASLAAFVSAYVVHGLFEDPLWLAFGILLGLSIGLRRASCRCRSSAPPL